MVSVGTRTTVVSHGPGMSLIMSFQMLSNVGTSLSSIEWILYQIKSHKIPSTYIEDHHKEKIVFLGFGQVFFTGKQKHESSGKG